MSIKNLQTKIEFASKIVENLLSEVKETLELSHKEDMYNGAVEKQRKIGQSRSKNGNIVRVAERNTRRLKKPTV